MRVFFRQFLPASVAVTLSLGPALTAPAQQSDDFSPPPDYYAPAEGLTQTELRSALHAIIDDHNALEYDAMRTAPRVLDVDPENPENIILLYSGESVPGHRFNSLWNREHLWPQSFGADTSYTPGTDFHHLFPTDTGVNSARSNLYFDNTNPLQQFTHPDAPESTYDNDSWEPRDEDKGRVARAMLYMDLRYELGDVSDFILGEVVNKSATTFGKLSTLLEWNLLYPPDPYEKRRNHLIHTGFSFSRFSYQQGNRNPFVDFPFLAGALHAPAGEITRGAWLWESFSVANLLQESITGDLADPDGDHLPNLLEYAFSLDPHSPAHPEILDVFRFPGFGTQLTYRHQQGADFSRLSFTLERSFTPLRAETWEPIPESDITSETLSPEGHMVEIVTSIRPPSEPIWYRIRVARQTTPDTSVSVIYDPALASQPDLRDSLFVYYSVNSESGFRESTWMGALEDDFYPWVFHVDHGWLYFRAQRDDNVWFYDETAGWLFTTSALYPYVFHAGSSSWLYFVRQTAKPKRWFYHPQSGWLPENELP